MDTCIWVDMPAMLNSEIKVNQFPFLKQVSPGNIIFFIKLMTGKYDHLSCPLSTNVRIGA